MADSNRELLQFVYDPLQSSRSIRLLRVTVPPVSTALQSNVRSSTTQIDETCYELVEVPLSTCSDTYEAVSYAWGNTTQNHALKINGQYQLPITETLANALPYLIRPCSTGYLWIDQICINQSDLQERGQQVSLMGEIYSGALGVLVWTGSEIERLSGALSRSLQPVRGKGLGKRHQKALNDLFEQPWFRRGWVIQEAVMAKNITFVSGIYAFSAENLQHAMIQISFRSFESLFGHRAFDNIMSLRDNSPDKLYRRFDEVLIGFAKNKTSDPRDQVYAFLGLARDPRVVIVPDYSAPVSIVYRNTARAIIEGTKSLGLFRSLPNYKTDSFELPSWVPNWSNPGRLWIPIDKIRMTRRLNAANDRRHSIESLPGSDTTILQIFGRIVDYPCRKLPNPLYLIKSTIRRNMKIPRAFWSRSMFSILKKFGSTSSGMFNWTDAQVKAIDPSAKTDSTKNLQHRLISVLSFGLDNPNDIIDLYNGERHSISNGMYYRQTFMWRWVRGSELWHTKAGKFVLLAPDVCEEGDAIAIIHGAKAPILLGEGAGDTFTIKGFCYLEDAMNGEAVTWEEHEADVFKVS